MRPPRDESTLPRLLARYTPDSRRWRRRVALLAAVGAPVALYAMVAIISGVKTGIVYNLLIVAFGLLALVLPALAATTLLAPDLDPTGGDQLRETDAFETLKQRYASGEIEQAEFDERLDDLMEASDGPRERTDGASSKHRVTSDPELDSTGR